jgi:tetrahydromethanopterin S-methyltransferase subunit H
MEQHALQIGAARIGGPFGSNTSLLCASIFYKKHSVVSDAVAGKFDSEKAGRLLDRATMFGERYGVQMAIDVIAASEAAVEKFLAFTAARTRLPIMIGATEADIRVAGLKAADRLGVLNRCIFASLSEGTEVHELDALGRHRPAAVMVLASDPSDPTPEGSCTMVENFFHPMLREIGVETPIVDLGVTDPPSVGIAMRGITAVRTRFGYPAGCAFSNCLPRWTGLKALGKSWVNLSLGASLVACRAAGADFLHYGPIEKADVMAHAAASAEVFYGFAAQELDGQRLPEGHALFKVLELTPLE